MYYGLMDLELLDLINVVIMFIDLKQRSPAQSLDPLISTLQYLYNKLVSKNPLRNLFILFLVSLAKNY